MMDFGTKLPVKSSVAFSSSSRLFGYADVDVGVYMSETQLRTMPMENDIAVVTVGSLSNNSAAAFRGNPKAGRGVISACMPGGLHRGAVASADGGKAPEDLTTPR
jgi:hypothetical protein